MQEDAALVLQTFFRMQTERERFFQMNSASLVLETTFRRFLAKKNLILLERNRAATKIQVFDVLFICGRNKIIFFSFCFLPERLAQKSCSSTNRELEAFGESLESQEIV